MDYPEHLEVHRKLFMSQKECWLPKGFPPGGILEAADNYILALEADRAQRAAPGVQGGEALEAARYRWLRNQALHFDQIGSSTPYVIRGQIMDTLDGDNLDAAVDRAMVIATAQQTQPAAAGGVPKWIDDPHDIEQGRMLNPAWLSLHGLTTKEATAQQTPPAAADGVHK